MDDTQLQLDKLSDAFASHDHDGINSLKPLSTSMVSATVITGSTAANYSVIFVAPFPCVVKFIYEVHTVAGTVNGTLNVEKLTGTTAPGSGTVLLSSDLSLTSTANTYQRGTNVGGATMGLSKGDRLALKPAGTLTTVGVVCVTILIQYQY